MTYDPGFYDIINGGSLRSAEVIVPRVLALTKAKSVVDLGCGEGAWAGTFKNHGCSVVAVDGDYVDRSRLLVAQDEFTPWNLATERIHFKDRFDLAISLEVAEHLPADRAQSFVEDLCEAAPMVLFSAAIPGQGGVGHINEQWPDYWVQRFQACGYRVSGALRFEFWEDERIENWYRQNLMLCAEERLVPAFAELFDSPASRPIPLVHPVLFSHIRSLLPT